MNGSRVLSSQTFLIGSVLLTASVIGMLAVSNGALTIALPLLLVGGLILFAWPMVGLLMIAATIPLEAALMIGGRSAAALVGMAVFGIWAVQKLLRREPLLPLISTRLIQLALLLFALACASVLWAYSPQDVRWRVVLLLQLILLSVLVLDLASTWERAAWVARVLVLAGAVAALVTLEQYFVGGARRAGAGVVGGLNRTAMTLVTILPFAFFLWRSRGPQVWRLLGLGYIVVSAIAVSATLSRMNFLLFPLVVLFQFGLMARTRGERRRVFVLAAVGVTAVSFMPMDAVRHRAESIVPFLSRTVGVEHVSEEVEYRAQYTGRSFFMRMGVEMFKDRPLLGVGYGNFQPLTDAYQWRVPRSPYEWVRPGRSPHSSHVAILAGLGIVGFMMWVGLFGIALLYMWRVWRGGADPISHRVLLAQAVGVAVALQLFYGFYSEIHQDKIVWLILGLAVAIHRLAVAQTPGAEQDPPRVGGSPDEPIRGELSLPS